MIKKISLLTLMIATFYSGVASCAPVNWIQPNLITDVGTNTSPGIHILSLSPRIYTTEWGVKTETVFRNIGYFIMLRSESGARWQFLDNAYQSALKLNVESDPLFPGKPTFVSAVNDLKKKSGIYSNVTSIAGVVISYCVGFGYSSYKEQSNITSDGRPKRIDGTDYNFNDSDMSCGRIIPNYIPCKAQASTLDLKFGTISLTDFNTAKANTTLTINCVGVAGAGNTTISSLAYKLKMRSNSIKLDNGTEAFIYIEGRKITATEYYGIRNTTQKNNLEISATLSGTPTKTGAFKGSGYLVMEFL
ncbi:MULTISPECIES: fimbrial protein [Enterobacter]|uniref:Adhesin n=1 Tax=Enterobacter cloacae TaxID=550 RepID=A0A330GBQ6_ENTCL|nr:MULTISPECIES: fimbrial protein [Enterobacter cloacae complex]MEC5764430.1 fimbrial protein [Enterobacter chengduensis]NBC81062.1 hypothetical protein [Enterobacter asburiae]RAZ62018.1 hypothetical protein DP202_24945 [Enterobacter cloacae]HBM9904663.1 fimbrial protein [Enterobacter chengduensis]